LPTAIVSISEISPIISTETDIKASLQHNDEDNASMGRSEISVRLILWITPGMGMSLWDLISSLKSAHPSKSP
jgi:hypothetical protein